MKSHPFLKYVLLIFAAFFLVVALVFACQQNNNVPVMPEQQEEQLLQEEQYPDSVTIYVTTVNRSYDFAKIKVAFDSANTVRSQATIVLAVDRRYQTMDGFGVAITGSTCFNLLKMAKNDRTKFLTETFSSTQGMGYSYVRIAIGASDFSLNEYTCCDTPGIENFALTAEENDYIIPVLKEILAINPDLKIMGSPWTCPRWMKVNDLTRKQPYYSWTSGQLNPDYYQDYGTYFVKWIQAFAGNGITIYAITPQNEPLNHGNSVSLYMGWDEQRDFVNGALVPKLEASGLHTKIYLFDHNYNYDGVSSQYGYPAKIYAAGVNDDFVVGAAYHSYGGNRSELQNIHAQYPDKELVFTETSIGTWNNGRNLAVRLMEDMREVALGTVNNWCKAVIVWNLMLDSDLGPNRPGGCQTCYGAVDISRSDYKTITRNSHYYIIGHLSSVVKPGATRIGADGEYVGSVIYSAFENTDGTCAVVLLNNTAAGKSITFDDGINHFTHEAPAQSVVSYQWKKQSSNK
jgi:glucosylceramidase